MTDAPVVIYLEPDDEVTSVVRRIRAAEPGPLVLVTPGRSRATSSVVALRLLARTAAGEGRPISVVGDALTRSLAAEAGVAAHASLDAARAQQVAPEPGSAERGAEPRRATISVVRGHAGAGTSTIPAAAAPPLSRPARQVPRAPAPPAQWSAADVTAPRPAVRRPAPPRANVRRSRDRAVPAALLVAALAVLLAAGAAGAMLLPAATVTITPTTEAVGPVEYPMEVADAERTSGTVTATHAVVPTGTYTVQEPATGAVVLRNWGDSPVAVPAGTYVAAGEQAFATQADVSVPRGRLTAEGTIAAGEAEVAVVAAAPGPAANVPAEAIDTVVSESIDASLRGFPENAQRRVVNPQPTMGGVDASGPEITQDDVDAAVAALRATLEGLAADAAASAAADGLGVAAPRGEPTIDGAEELAGTRDVERAEISGELGWEVLVADADAVTDQAVARFRADESLVPPGHALLPETVEARVAERALDGNRLVMTVRVSGRSTAGIDEDEVRRRVAGRDANEAAAALADMGTATVELWPGWARSVPTLDWRIEVRIDGAGDGEDEAAEPS